VTTATNESPPRPAVLPIPVTPEEKAAAFDARERFLDQLCDRMKRDRDFTPAAWRAALREFDRTHPRRRQTRREGRGR
jgi:hypothetical protein